MKTTNVKTMQLSNGQVGGAVMKTIQCRERGSGARKQRDVDTYAPGRIPLPTDPRGS